MIRKLGGSGSWPPKPAKKPKREWPKNPFGHGQQSIAIDALRKGVCVTLTYHDCYRVAEVHTVGNTRARRPAMSVYQVDGQSNESTIPDWQLFCFDECFNVALSDIPSRAPRPDYKKGAKQFLTIVAEL